MIKDSFINTNKKAIELQKKATKKNSYSFNFSLLLYKRINSIILAIIKNIHDILT